MSPGWFYTECDRFIGGRESQHPVVLISTMCLYEIARTKTSFVRRSALHKSELPNGLDAIIELGNQREALIALHVDGMSRFRHGSAGITLLLSCVVRESMGTFPGRSSPFASQVKIRNNVIQLPRCLSPGDCF
ncbi:unnamed protein product [Pieris macdunnoughi]|uniref:Uncharacterized protein n=1 Tax=Pieris macdunnoughi TaxID=345717 RepID=A0A821LNQ7_9NEOP|nr:unnamed protein product [Pieris macdunnoughi]